AEPPEVVSLVSVSAPGPLGRWKTSVSDRWVHGLLRHPAAFPGIQLWQVETTDLPAARGRAQFHPDGRLFVVPGVLQLRIYRRNSDGFQLVSVIPGDYSSVGWRPGHDEFAAASMYGQFRITGADGNTVWSMPLSRPQADNSRLPRLAWAPDGKQVAVTLTNRAATGSQLYILDVVEQKIVRTIPTQQAAMDVVWPRADRLVGVFEDSSYRVWDPDQTAPVERFEIHELTVDIPESRAVVSADGKTVAWCTRHNAGTLATWNSETKTPGTVLRDVPNFYYGNLKFSGDGTKLAALLDVRHGNVGIWDVDSGRRLLTGTHENPHDPKSHEVAWTTDGTAVATVLTEADDAVKLWNVQTGAVVSNIPGADSGVVADLAWSDYRSRLAFPGRDGMVKLLDTESLQFFDTALFPDTDSNHAKVIHKLAWHDSGQRLAATRIVSQHNVLRTDGAAVDLKSGRLLATLPVSRSAWTTLAISPDGVYLAAAENAQFTVPRLFVWNLNTAEPPAEFQKNSGATERSFNSPLAWYGRRIHFFEPTGMLSQWDADRSLPGVAIDPPPAPGITDPIDIAVHPGDGRIAVVGFRDHQVVVFDARGRLLSVIGMKDPPTSAAWHPVQNLLAVASLNGSGVRLYDGSSYSPNGVNWDPGPLLWRLRWNHDGSLLAGFTQENSFMLASLRGLQTWGIILNCPDGSTALLSPAGELISEHRDARKRLLCRFQRVGSRRWEVLDYDQFISEFDRKDSAAQ
ncbi:MAG: WD40 repeat domain-containing protein, partial [Planctomycetaceae bacterium]|nr:WD40 repeat domain-containing protein [Planctomycetaceae bacterium]